MIMTFRMASTPPAIKCTAKKRNGEPCNRWALRGGLVCQVHGGNLPVVKKAAEQRVAEAREAIIELVPKAVRRLETSLEAESETVVLAAAKEILDRAGMVVVRRSEVKEERAVHPQEVALDEVIRELVRRKARELTGETVLEAEVVVEDDITS